MRKEKSRPHKAMNAGPAAVAEKHKQEAKQKKVEKPTSHVSQIQFGEWFVGLFVFSLISH
jgi:hypothetical protein